MYVFFSVLCPHYVLTTAFLVNSFQCTSSHSKRPKNEEDEKLSATVGGTEGPTTPDPDPYDLKDDGKPEEAVKLANTEAPSEKETSVSRMQLDHNLSDNIRFSGEKLADYVSRVSSR